MVRNSKQQIQSLLQKFPLSVKERQELQQRTERNHMNEGCYEIYSYLDINYQMKFY